MKINGSNEVNQKTSTSNITRGETTQDVTLFKFETNDKDMGLQIESKDTGDKSTKEIKDNKGKLIKVISLTARGAVNITEYDTEGRIKKEECYDLKEGAVRVYDAEKVDLANFDLVFRNDIKYDTQNNKQTTSFYNDDKIRTYELRNQYNQVLEVINYTQEGHVINHIKNKYDNFTLESSEDLSENYQPQKYNYMVVEHDERAALTKTIERITKGCLIVTEFNNGEPQVKTYAPKDIVNWKEPDLNNINWDDYEPFDL